MKVKASSCQGSWLESDCHGSHHLLNKLTLAHLALESAVNAASPVLSCSPVKQTSHVDCDHTKSFLQLAAER